VRLRQLAPVALILGLTVAGFFGARLLGRRDVRVESEHRAEVAAAQIRGRVEQGATLVDGLRRFMVGVAGRGVTSKEFAGNVSRWLTPAGFPAAAWVEQVSASERAAYESRIGNRIVTQDRQGRIAPVGPRSSYLPTTLVSGIPPMTVPGIDLSREPGTAPALARASTLYDAGATPLAIRRDGTKGLFLIRLAPRLTGGVVHPGFLVVYMSEVWLRAAATETASFQLTVGGTSGGDEGAGVVRTAFTEAGQRFEVVVPRSSVHGAAALLPWIILTAGILLAGLAGALGVNAARRGRAQEDLDRIFSLSPDLIAVADFEGRFTRVNPAVEQILGYTEEEFLARPYLDYVHPDDRERTEAEAAAITEGRTTLSFQNRYMGKDGSYRVLEWTSRPIVERRAMYAVARDVTERRRAAAELARLADEQAALRRMATLVAQGVPPAEIFSAVSAEVSRLFSAHGTTVDLATAVRFDPGPEVVLVGASKTIEGLPLQARWEPIDLYVSSKVLRTGRSARIDESELDAVGGPVAESVRRMDCHSQVGSPIIVEGELWGAMTMNAREALPPDTEERLEKFTELLGTAIANAESRSELAASRRRIVAASDEARRRIERDLHDGVQQQLVSLQLELQELEAAMPPNDELQVHLSRVTNGLDGALKDLVEIARGIHPAILSRGGLTPALQALARRSGVSVQLDADIDSRLPQQVEVAAYYVVSEALTNAAKHARASVVHVDVVAQDGTLRLSIRDDGVGGADPRQGSGLVGLQDRVEALGGMLRVDSPPGSGTSLGVKLPIKEPLPG
jgi:PAS domain S-box-containing protein